jgi:formylglycine-generating enzyme required for sulfatase activity
MNFDIPTEVMHEIATRAGTETPYFWGSDASLAPQYAVYGRSGERPSGGWEFSGTKKPNAWGVYDMVGLDWEWCLDSYVAGDDPATHTDVFTPYISEGATQWRARGGGATATVTGMLSSNRSGASIGDLNKAPQIYPFRLAYIVPNSGE